MNFLSKTKYVSFKMSYEKQMRIANEVVEQNAFDLSELFFGT